MPCLKEQALARLYLRGLLLLLIIIILTLRLCTCCWHADRMA